MNLGKPLRPGDQISAEAWNAVRTLLSPQMGSITPDTTNATRGRLRLYGRNMTDKTFNPGRPIELCPHSILQIDSAASRETAESFGVILDAYEPSGIPDALIAVPLQPIKPEGVGEVNIAGPVACECDISKTKELSPTEWFAGVGATAPKYEPADGETSVASSIKDWTRGHSRMLSPHAVLLNNTFVQQQSFLINTQDFNECFPDGLKRGDVVWVSPEDTEQFDYVNGLSNGGATGWFYDHEKNAETSQLAVVTHDIRINWPSNRPSRHFFVPFTLLRDCNYANVEPPTYQSTIDYQYIPYYLDDTTHTMRPSVIVDNETFPARGAHQINALLKARSLGSGYYYTWVDQKTSIVIPAKISEHGGRWCKIFGRSLYLKIYSDYGQLAQATVNYGNTRESAFVYDLYKDDTVLVEVIFLADSAADFEEARILDGPRDWRPGSIIWSLNRPGRGWEVYEVNPIHGVVICAGQGWLEARSDSAAPEGSTVSFNTVHTIGNFWKKVSPQVAGAAD